MLCAVIFLLVDGERERHLIQITAPDFLIEPPPFLGAGQVSRNTQTACVHGQLQGAVLSSCHGFTPMVIIHHDITHLRSRKRAPVDDFLVFDTVVLVQHGLLVKNRRVPFHTVLLILFPRVQRPHLKSAVITGFRCDRHCRPPLTYRPRRPDWTPLRTPCGCSTCRRPRPDSC